MSFMGGLLLAIGARSRSILVFILYCTAAGDRSIMSLHAAFPTTLKAAGHLSQVPKTVLGDHAGNEDDPSQ
jgi:hypothetical protein